MTTCSKYKLTGMYIKLVEGTLEFSTQKGVEQLCCVLYGYTYESEHKMQQDLNCHRQRNLRGGSGERGALPQNLTAVITLFRDCDNMR